MKMVSQLKKQVESEVKKQVKDVLKKDIPFSEMAEELSKKAVQKRLLEELRESPALTLNHNELFQTCRFIHDGIKENQDVLGEAIQEVGTNFNDLKNLERIFSPLGNFIIGVKTARDWCADFMSSEEFKKMNESYGKYKGKIDDILGHIVDELGIWESEVRHVGREHGVFEEPKGKHPVLYNIEEIGIRYPEFATIVKEIKSFKEENPDKQYVNFKGVKTAAFKKYLQR